MSGLTKSRRIPNITAIRFVLALLVVVFHISEFSRNRGFPFYNELAVFHKGTEAVYVFFSLSGFLIIKQLFDEKRLANFVNLKKFYIRRILRIFPLYYLVLIFGFLYYRLILPFFGFEFDSNYDLFSGIFLSITFFSNIFSTYSPGGILEVLWSIGIEEQFYLLIAPMFLKIPVKRIVLFLSLFTGVYFVMYFSDSLAFLEKFNMLFFYFSFGGICSILLDNSWAKIFIKKLRYFLFSLFVIYFTTAIFVNSFNAIFYQLFSFLLFGLTISALAVQPIKIFQNKTMNYLGKISYGVYMYHAIVMQLVGLVYLKLISKMRFHYAFDVLIINLSIIIITVIISHISFKYYESFFLNLKEKRDVKRL